MSDSIGDVSKDGYWVLTEDGWQPTEEQNQALAEGAIPHDSVTQMVTLGGGPQSNSLDTIILPDPGRESSTAGDKQLINLIGGLIILFGIIDFISFNLLDIDVTGVWWSAILAGIVGSSIMALEFPIMELESAESSSKTQGILVGIGAFGLLVIFLSVLLSSPDGELANTWVNDVDTLVLSEDGKVTESTGSFSEWRADSDTLMFSDSSDPDYEYWFEYEISNDVLFLAPLDEDDSIMGELCVAYVKKGVDFNEAFAQSTQPSWCTG